MKRLVLYSLILTMLFPLWLGAQSARSEKVQVKTSRMTVSELADFIERNSHVKMVVDEAGIDSDKRLELPQGLLSVEELVKAAFADSGMSAIFSGDYLAVISMDKTERLARLGGKAVSGTVKDENGEPLIGASVTIPGSTRGVVTDTDGRFSINLITGTVTLEASFLGQQTRAVVVDPDNASALDIVLQSDNNTLDELVVIGYGSQAKRDITGAITSISSKDIDKNVGGSIETSLQGKIPGLNIVTNSGEPGTSSTITLRGASSINGSCEPLYIIDGVPMESESIASIMGDASFNPMAGINPSDIESIEVLRDAASAAIYGSRAANGVIIITTKGGGGDPKYQKPTVKISHNSSVAIVSRRLDVMNSHDFRQAYVDGRTNAGLSLDQPWITNPAHPYYANSTNWQKILLRPTYQSKTDLSVSGSSDNISYSISGGFTDNDPVLRGTSYRQYFVRGNFGYRVFKRLTGGTNITYSRTNYTRVMSGQSNMSSAIRAIVSAPPVYSPYDYETGGIPNSLGNNQFRNPLALCEKYPIKYKQDQTILSQYFKLNIVKGLDFRIRGSMEHRYVSQFSYFPKEYDSNKVDTARQSDSKLYKYFIENTFEFHRKFSDHDLSAVLGQSWQSNRTETFNIVGRNYMDESQLLIQNASTWSTVQQLISTSSLLSFFGRFGYNYKSRYIAQLTFRADGSSRFGSGKRFGFFPSASLGWRFSDERFMLFARKVLTDGKLRLSVGVTGNQKIGDYTWQGLYSTSTAGYGGNVAVLDSALSNDELGWERTVQYNAGLDLSFIRGRVTLNFDAYIKDTDNLLFNAPLPGYTGFNVRSCNFGSIRNKGIELALNTVNIDRRNFTWSTNINFSMNRNKVTALADGEDVIYTTRGIYALCRVGEPLGLFYGWRALGVYANDNDNVWTNPETGETRPILKGSEFGEAFKGGDMIWEDINNDGIINDDDRVIIGNPHPDFTGGFGTTITWKNWSLNAYFNYSIGGDIVNSQRRLRNKMAQMMNLGTDALARWRTPGDQTDFPMLRYGDPMDNFRPSTFIVEDASYVRFKDLVLSYSLPRQVCKKMHVQTLSFSAICSNLLVWSNYSGFDPEVNTSDTAVVTGLDDGAFPKTRNFGLGINLIF